MVTYLYDICKMCKYRHLSTVLLHTYRPSKQYILYINSPEPASLSRMACLTGPSSNRGQVKQGQVIVEPGQARVSSIWAISNGSRINRGLFNLEAGVNLE
jgi:C4-type Zn-finger protein